MGIIKKLRKTIITKEEPAIIFFRDKAHRESVLKHGNLTDPISVTDPTIYARVRGVVEASMKQGRKDVERISDEIQKN